MPIWWKPALLWSTKANRWVFDENKGCRTPSSMATTRAELGRDLCGVFAGGALFPYGIGIGEAGDGRGPPPHDPV